MAKGNGKPAPHQPAEAAPQRPAHEVRLGRIKAAVWATDGQYGTRHTVKVCKLYKAVGGDGERWQTTDVFGREDLLALAKVVDMAHTWVCENTQGPEIPY